MKWVLESPEQLLEEVESYLIKLHNEGGRIQYAVDEEWNNGRDQTKWKRCSSAGKCTRQLAYWKHHPDKAEPIRPRALSIFLNGYSIHEQERWLISQVADLRFVERNVEFYPNQIVGVVPGRVDGVVQLRDGPALLDIKTAAEFGFRDMQRQGVPEEYKAQMQCYMDAMGIPRTIIWAYNKNTSHRAVHMIEWDELVHRKVADRFTAVELSTPENLPDRDFKPKREVVRKKETGREYLVWQCSYCPFTEMCYGPLGFELTFDEKTNKPRWIKDA